MALVTKRLWRAAQDDYVDTGYSFAESKTIAREYLDNPGFGGATIFRAVVEFDEEQVLDLRGVSLTKARRMVDVPSASGAIGVDEWLPRESRVQEAFRDQGFLWALVDESFPEGTTTWIWLGTSSDDEPELEAV